jgi:hypothetical protein
MLFLSYDLSAPSGLLAIPAPVESPARKDGLWEGTCFEFFIAKRDSEAYREFNISPSGDWNVYCFTSYRQGMREEPAFSSFPCSIGGRPGSLRLSLELDLRKVGAAETDLDIGVSAVVSSLDGIKTYWALAHPGSRPDFHRRDCFVLKI